MQAEEERRSPWKAIAAGMAGIVRGVKRAVQRSPAASSYVARTDGADNVGVRDLVDARVQRHEAQLVVVCALECFGEHLFGVPAICSDVVLALLRIDQQ